MVFGDANNLAVDPGAICCANSINDFSRIKKFTQQNNHSLVCVLHRSVHS